MSNNGICISMKLRKYTLKIYCILLLKSNRTTEGYINLYRSIPIAHSTTLMEKYEEIKFVLDKFATRAMNG